jgi:DNA-binding transcriptional regulator GbsR (MarR family)
MNQNDKIQLAIIRLIETGGRTSQDLGLGRIVGQILVYLYLQPEACSLEELENDLGLSKASVSIAARQLEQLGLVQRVWLKGDRKKYYRSAENIGQAIQQGVLSLVRQKVGDFGSQLDSTMDLLEEAEREDYRNIQFLIQRVKRARTLQRGLDRLLGSPLVRFFAKNSEQKQ